MIFVDTNYFLRFLLKDDEQQYLIVRKLFIESARRKIKLVTSLVVFFEVVWVLKSSYGKDKKSMVETLFNMLKLDFEIPEKYQIIESLSLFQKTNLSLEDCYNLVFAKNINSSEFKTFDSKLDKVAKELLEKETLDNEEFEKLVGKKKINS